MGGQPATPCYRANEYSYLLLQGRQTFLLTAIEQTNIPMTADWEERM